MKIYFAGSIRGGRQDKELYEQIIGLLGSYGEVLTEHIGDKTLSALGEQGPTPEYIYRRDMDWLTTADVVVAEVTQPSLGVGYEIGKMDGVKPVLCLFRKQEDRLLSAMIVGSKSLVVKEYTSITDAEAVLKDFFTMIQK